MLGWLSRLLGRTEAKTPAPAPSSSKNGTFRVRRPIRAGYDAAQTVDDNRRHWANADDLSALSANSADVRMKLRKRARYESANNSYCRGMILTLANDLIGTGPRLQVQTPDRAVNRQIERAFSEWMKETYLADKLRTLVQAKKVDGEAFATLTTNKLLPTSVQLDIKLIEADRVAKPSLFNADESDGIEFDSFGNPVVYHVLREHPGDSLTQFGQKADRIPARFMAHWFRCDRPGQVRGIPEITPAIPLYAQLRRYTLAVIAAAETAADFAGILKSDSAAADADPADPWETVEIEQRTLMTLPMGWSLQQFKAEQPATNYGMFKAEILAEIARCLHFPYIVASGDYKGANYSSGRLAHQVYFKSILVERSSLEKVVLDLILFAWLNEAVMVPGLVPRGLSWTELKHSWRWDGWVHVDPQKEAQAAKTLLGSRLTTLAEYYAERGQDWEAQLEQRALEIRRAVELGLSPTLEEEPGQPWQSDQPGTEPPVGNESSDEQTLEEDAAEQEDA